MDNINIKKMARKTNIDVGLIKKALSVSFADIYNAKTFDEAREDYENASDSPEENKAIIDKWLELASNVDEITDIHSITTDRGMMSKDQYTILVKKQIEFASTIEEVRTVCDAAPTGSEEEKKAIRKLAGFFSKEPVPV